ncbi:serine/threonine protein kinase [Geodermatophilus sp. YIM 151500]|uniref:serine/threonine-protein kinase n=1 Tax=Geodermatophilus sp. YIM 151500 TaxID=2984531 RepID=UPI0021E40721|nr:serine/threonine-protein kinase [Geodermatophilus sp. YIM 151500]MCV2491615.1 serine/threonine protein kinase [Geodermatophilus sp. YIM 151500]
MQAETRVLGERYELVSRLATGGMGQVWRARDTLLNRPVAVKILRSEFSDNPTFRARFQAEARHAAALIHPNIASVFDYGEVRAGDGEPLAYLVMELVDGESLSSLLEREPRLDPQLTVSIVRQTAAALAAAHAAGVVHRDIKPGNVLVAPDGVVKITDFGIAWSASSVPLTETGQVVGTAYYLSPEQAQGGKASPASDVYALGAVAYECLAGRRLFEGDSSVQVALRQIRDEPDPLPDDVPGPVRALVTRALAKDPAQRFPDGAALRDAAEAVLTGRPAPLADTAVLPLPLGPGAGGAATAAAGASGWAHPSTAPMPAAGAGAGSAPDEGADGRRRGLKAALAVAFGVLAVVAVVTGVVLADPGPPAGSTTPVETSSAPPTPSGTAPAGVLVDAAAYVGRPLADVRDELVGLGLQVTALPVETVEQAPGAVTAVAPVGELVPGSTVEVAYAVAPAPPPPAPEPTPTSGTDPGEGDGGNENRGNSDGGNENRGNGNSGNRDGDDDD